MAHLCTHFRILRGVFGREIGVVRAVDDVSFDLGRREVLGIVGESGCGKSTLLRSIARAITPTSGSVTLRPDTGSAVDVASASPAQLLVVRRQMQMVFQDPYGSLDPRRTVYETVSEPLRFLERLDRPEMVSRAAASLDRVGLGAQYLDRYPHALSGGQRQRVGIARALASRPSILAADEPVSALDTSTRAQIINLLLQLQDELGLAILFVSHDLSVVSRLCDRVLVMYVGRVVELASADQLFLRPRHPYTEALLKAVPSPDPSRPRTRTHLTGEPADPANPPAGCAFHPRCPYATGLCRSSRPPLETTAEGTLVACHHKDELSLDRPVQS